MAFKFNPFTSNFDSTLSAPEIEALFQSQGSIKIPVLTTAQKNALTPATGMVLYDSDLKRAEQYNGSIWEPIGGVYSLSPVSLSGGTDIVPADARDQMIPISGNGGAVSASDIDTANALYGDRLTIVGTSDTNTVTIVGTASVIVNGSCTLASNESISFIFYGTSYVEVSRSN